MLSRVDCLEKDRFLGFLLGGRVGALEISPSLPKLLPKSLFFWKFLEPLWIFTNLERNDTPNFEHVSDPDFISLLSL
jgi:hypothetical protein